MHVRRRHVRRGQSRNTERRRHTSRDVQGDTEEDTGNAPQSADGSAGQLRPRVKRILFRPAPSGLCADS